MTQLASDVRNKFIIPFNIDNDRYNRGVPHLGYKQCLAFCPITIFQTVIVRTMNPALVQPINSIYTN